MIYTLFVLYTKCEIVQASYLAVVICTDNDYFAQLDIIAYKEREYRRLDAKLPGRPR